MPKQVDETMESWIDADIAHTPVDPLADATALQEELDVTASTPSGKARLLSHGKCRLNELFSDPAELTAAERNIRAVLRQKYALANEYGFADLNLVSGIARWPAARVSHDSQTAITRNLPVLLYPISVEPGTDGSLRDAVLTSRARCVLNPQLVAALKRDGIVIDPASLVNASKYVNGIVDSQVVADRLVAAASHVIPQFEIIPRLIVACWNNPACGVAHRAQHTLSLMKRTGQTGIVGIDAMAGNADAQAMLKRIASINATRDGNASTAHHDDEDESPHHEFEVGDVSNQTRRAAHMAGAGQSLFLDTPSNADSARQALAIATRLAAQGRFVVYSPVVRAQKTAFLHAAAHEGVTDLVMDASDPNYAQAIDASLKSAVSSHQEDHQAIEHFNQCADQLVGVRSRIHHYFGSLHEPIKPWGVSVYEVIENLARVSALPTHPVNRVRLSQHTVLALKGHLKEYGQSMVRLGQVGEYALGPNDTAWYHASLYSQHEARQAIDRVYRVLDQTLPAIRQQIDRTVSTCGFVIPQKVTQWGQQISVLQSLRNVLDVFQPAIFERDLTLLLDATLNREERKKRNIQMSMGERHRAIKEARRLLRPGRRVKNLHAALEIVQRQAEQWRTVVPRGGWPVLPDGIDEMLDTFDSLTSDLTALEVVLSSTPRGAGFSEMTFVDLDARLRLLYQDRDSLKNLPERATLERDLVKVGLGDLLSDLSSRHIDPKAAPDELALAWWSTVFELIVHSSDMIANQDGSALADAAQTFARVDREHVASIGPLLLAEIRHRLSDLLYSRVQDANQLHALLASPLVPSCAKLYHDYPEILRCAKPIIVVTPGQLATEFPISPVRHTAVSAAGVSAAGRIETFADVVIIDACAHAPSAQVLAALSVARTAVIEADSSVVTSPIVQRAAHTFARVRVPRPIVSPSAQLARFCQEHGHALSVCPQPRNQQGSVSCVWVDAIGIPVQQSGVVESTSAEVNAVLRCARSWADRHVSARSRAAALSRQSGQAGQDTAQRTASRGQEASAHAPSAQEHAAERGTGFDPAIALSTNGRYGAVTIAPSRHSGSQSIHTSISRLSTSQSAQMRSSAHQQRPKVDVLVSASGRPHAAESEEKDQALSQRRLAHGLHAHLSIVALNAHHAAAIRRGLARAATKDPTLRAVWDVISVAPITQCAALPAGDVIISTGFAKTTHGMLLQQFGAIEHEGGDRLLMHALDLAAGDLTLVCAFHSGDMLDERLTHKGSQLLKSVISWTEQCENADQEPAIGHPGQHNVLLDDIARRLRKRGYSAETQYGFDPAHPVHKAESDHTSHNTSENHSVLLPLVVGKPHEGMSVAVYTDDRAFMSLHSMRLRHRIIPESLENLGWKVVQLWSVGLFVDPDSQVERIIAALSSVHHQHPVQGQKRATTRQATTRRETTRSTQPIQSAHSTRSEHDAQSGKNTEDVKDSQANVPNKTKDKHQ